ncbi:MAG: hypothetical protein QOJ27_1936 [Sphingomonadales bacterium]|nr:hypothetical protein [Sphingomonadales bacterium]
MAAADRRIARDMILPDSAFVRREAGAAWRDFYAPFKGVLEALYAFRKVKPVQDRSSYVTVNEALYGRIDIDVMYGGSGEDALSGGRDNDMLSGGSGEEYAVDVRGSAVEPLGAKPRRSSVSDVSNPYSLTMGVSDDNPPEGGSRSRPSAKHSRR